MYSMNVRKHRKYSAIREIICKYEKIVCKYLILLELPIPAFWGFCKTAMMRIRIYGSVKKVALKYPIKKS